MIDLWTSLKEQSKPIVLYGMGNGADKIADELEKRGMEVSAYFASDDFVRGQLFRGKRVMKYAEVKELYPECVILVAFASQLPDVMARIEAIDSENELYVPDVPVVGGRVFDSAFYEENLALIKEARELFADEESRVIYDNILMYKLTGKLSYLKKATSSQEVVFRSLLDCERYTSCADLGAYNGDSVREFMRVFPNLEKVVSLEPDRRNFKKLSRFVDEAGLSFVECHNCAAWCENGEMAFSASGNRNARAGEGKGVVEVRTLDSILDGARVDYIKYDVEGSEYEALLGSMKTIEHYEPDLLVSLYHRNEDIFRLPVFVRSLLKDHKLYLRRFPYIPAWDLNLYAVKKKI